MNVALLMLALVSAPSDKRDKPKEIVPPYEVLPAVVGQEIRQVVAKSGGVSYFVLCEKNNKQKD